jgi:dTDP-4-dehydrorhamnose reductase
LKLLITGASGLYGSKLAEIALLTGFEVFSCDVEDLPACGNTIKFDVTNKGLVDEAFRRVKPDIVVHAASLTDVDKCELNKELAWKVNVEGTRNIIEGSLSADSFLFYVSSDYIFNGEKGCYKETDTPDPINYYGLTKFEAEKLVKKSELNYCICRPSVIYGSNPASGKVNFSLWLIENLCKGERVRILTDQWNTPTLNTNLAEMTIEIIKRKLTGTFHLCGATRVSRFQFAQLIAETFGLDKGLINPAVSSTFSWPAKRPADSSLDTTKAEQVLQNKPLEIADAVKRLKCELAQKKSLS